MGDVTRALARFWPKVLKTTTCWFWLAGQMTDGHGSFYPGGVIESKGAHRFSYTVFVGPIPDGYDIDHICHRTSCVNPAHLQAVPKALNSQNRRGATRASRSGYRGVFWSGRRQGWMAHAEAFGKQHTRGVFATAEEANQAAISLRNSVMENVFERPGALLVPSARLSA